MKIGIVGVGVVGSAVKYGMEKLGHDVLVHDIRLNTRLTDLFQTEVCFICVPTPENRDGSCDSSIVESIVKQLAQQSYRGVIAIKSTVAPGTTEKLYEKYRKNYYNGVPFNGELRLAFVPEFLRERCAIADFTENHDVCVVGVMTAYGHPGTTISDEVFQTLRRAHGKYPQRFERMTPTEAELCKYFSNVFNAMRVTFANGFYEVCKKLGARYSTVKNAVVQRPTLIDMYLDCNEKFRGYAGVCLPKDTAAFAKLASDLGVDAKLFSTIVEDNKLYNATVYEHMRM